MNAVRKAHVPDNKTAAPPAPKLDQFGRNPGSAGEVLRRQTNYGADSGYAPLYAAWMADIPRLSSGQVCTLFLMSVAVLSLGRPDNPKRGEGGRRHEWTKPLTVEYLAELCRCHVRDVQRQIKELPARGLIAVEATGRGAYKISLLYRDWQKLPDYQPARVVAIDEPEESEPEESAGEVAADKDAVRLVKRPLRVNAGKTGRAIPVAVGVKSVRWQNAAPLPLVYDAFVQNGQLVISTKFASDWRETVGETTANVQRHGCRDGEGDALAVHPRAAEVVEIFDPLLERSGGRLLVGDAAAVLAAAKALGRMPRAFLVDWLHNGKSPRATRAISGPRVVASIVREAVAAWSRAERASAKGAGGDKGNRAGKWPAGGGKKTVAESVCELAAERLRKYGRI